tara:strand:+ start:192 stop:716 length:525 start_codon:yes stop_codon:yes gene_type:complete
MQTLQIVGAAITNAVKAAVKSGKVMTATVDTFIKYEICHLSTDWISPKSDGSTTTSERWVWQKEQVVLGFDKDDQKLLAMQVATVPQEMKAHRHYLQEQIGTRCTDFKKALLKREAAALDGGEAGRARSPERRIRENLEDCVKVCENTETASFDVVDMRTAIDAALVVLNKNIS